ncbi:MAG TPA: hypothetical protein VIQ02_04790 [Jiangellaceae bacterium]|jgi:hypothetical protein
MGVHERAELFGIHAPDVPDDRWFEYLKALAKCASEDHQPFEPEWD